MTRKEIWKDFFKKVIIPCFTDGISLLLGNENIYAKRRNQLFLCMAVLRSSFRYPKNVPVADSDKSRLYRNGGNICRKYHSRRIDWLHCDYLAASRCGMVHSAYNIQACQGITEFQTQKNNGRSGHKFMAAASVFLLRVFLVLRS